MGGGRLRAFADCSPAPDRLCLISVAPALSIIPVPSPSFLRRQEPTSPNTPFLLPSPIHPSPLPGGRLGGGWKVASVCDCSPTPRSPMPHLRRTRALHHSCSLLVIPVPSPSFLRRQEPTSPQYSFPAPFPNSSLPPSRGEVRWGVEGCERLPTALLHPDRLCLTSVHPRSPSFLLSSRHSCPLSVIPAQAGIRRPPASVRTAISRRPAQAASAPPDARSQVRAPAAWVPACAGMTERAERDWCAGAWPAPPHLTSPLEGGRDEIGEAGGCWSGWIPSSCLRRNDEGGAGMTEMRTGPSCCPCPAGRGP